MTLRSVLRQRDVNLEVIVVDEASTDDTPAMLAALNDSRVRVIRHDTPSGVANARNRAAAEAHGDWLAFLDDDDLWAPEKLVCQLQAAQDAGRDWAYTGAVVMNMHGQILRVQRPLPPEEVVTALPRQNAIPGGGSNVVVRRTTWKIVGPFNTRLRNTEDWEMWIRLAKHGTPGMRMQSTDCQAAPSLEFDARHRRDRARNAADRGAASYDGGLGQAAPVVRPFVSAGRAPLGGAR